MRGLVVSVVVLAAARASLSVDKRCGDVPCALDEYCSDFDKQCRPCADVCDERSHNYQAQPCQLQCQDYLHDQRYVKRAEDTPGDLSADVSRLYSLVAASLAVSVLLLVAVVTAILVVVVPRCRPLWTMARRRARKSAEVKRPVGNHNGVGEAGLRLDMPAPTTPGTTSTPLSRPRHPSEDTTLEYAAYDNPALTPSPVLEKEACSPQESSF